MKCLNTRSPEIDLQLNATRTSWSGVRLFLTARLYCWLHQNVHLWHNCRYCHDVSLILLFVWFVWHQFAFRETRGSFWTSVDAKLQITLARLARFPHHFIAAKLVARCHATEPFAEATVSARGIDWLHSVVAVRLASPASAIAVG